MIRVWDNELLTAKKGLSPVTDGLLLWIDGQDGFVPVTEVGQHDPSWYSLAYIKDRVSGANVTVTGSGDAGIANAGKPVFRLVSSGNNRVVITCPRVDNVKTVELVICGNDINQIIVAGLLGQQGYRLYYPDASNTWKSAYMEGVRDVVYYAQFLGQPNADTGLPEIYLNAVKKSNFGSSPQVITGFSVDRLIGNTWGRRIGSIRLYNRSLTSDEIAQNLAYEVSIGRVVL